MFRLEKMKTEEEEEGEEECAIKNVIGSHLFPQNFSHQELNDFYYPYFRRHKYIKILHYSTR